jgi:hypothetical protein
MKKRISRVLNFLAFNFLFLAIYLNFIHQDGNTHPMVSTNKKNQDIKGTVILSNTTGNAVKSTAGQVSLAHIN